MLSLTGTATVVANVWGFTELVIRRLQVQWHATPAPFLPAAACSEKITEARSTEQLFFNFVFRLEDFCQSSSLTPPKTQPPLTVGVLRRRVHVWGLEQTARTRGCCRGRGIVGANGQQPAHKIENNHGTLSCPATSTVSLPGRIFLSLPHSFRSHPHLS